MKPGTYQSFWISFDTGYIAIGRGTVPGKELLYDWYIKTLANPIEYFSFSSAANQLSFVNIATAPVF
ncbi:MAG: hypothetical protein EBX41_05885, partial [Chitinophagia bacterium]|nr:hypothetical protein [Chitinophagia bacterium]